MTYKKYEWTAFTEADLLGAGAAGTSVSKGDTFTMPGSASVTMSTWDDDGKLSGDNYDHATDHSGQYARVDGARVGSQMYAEKYHVLHGSDGKTYYLIEIEVEGYNAPGTGDDFFTFYGAVPPAGVTLTVGNCCNVSGHWVDYNCLGAGDDAPANTPPTFTNLPADGILCVDENSTFVIDINSDDADGDSVTYEIVGGRDAAFFEIDAHTGELTFKDAPDFENPQSGGNNNTYDVTVKVSDGNGGSETKALWVKVKDVEESTGGGECIVIEAETMHLNGYSIEHNSAASGGAVVKGQIGCWTSATTTFDGMAGEYDLKLYMQDESDGNSYVYVYVNGHDVSGLIRLDQDNNGKGGSSSDFSTREITVENLNLQAGDKVTVWGYGQGGEFVRLDKIELCKEGEPCPEGFGKLDFEGLARGTTVSNQFDGVTISAMENDAHDSATDNDAMIFDSNNPTGGDHDLGYAGRGNILIISEDDDAHDPDDSYQGGMITFDFDNPSDLENIVLLDIEEAGGTIELTFADGSTSTIAIPAAGNNSAQTIDLSAANVTSMKITLVGSGAVDDLCWKPGDAPQPGSLSGTYFEDTNKDGLDNDGANGVEGVLVELLDENGDPTGATATTDGNGNYSFGNLAAGTYGVKFTDTVTGQVLTEQNANGNANDDIDSDAADAGGNMSVISGIVVAAGADSSNNDAGVVDPGTASVGDTVWLDENGDGLLNNGEAGVGGVEVTLTGAGADGAFGTGDDTSETVTTAADGSYSFDELDAGDYKVTFNAAATGLAFTTASAAAADVANNDSDAGTGGMTDVFTLDIGEAEDDIDAGLVDPALSSISGRIFMDNNDNNLDDAEMGLGGVTVILEDADGNFIEETTTNDDGSYTFDNLAAGEYQVDFPTEVGGKVLVDPNAGDDTIDSDATQPDGETGTIVLGINEDIDDVDAGFEDPGSATIEGKVFMDNNDNNQNDAGDMPIGGVTVELLNSDGSTTDMTTMTANDGTYSFTGLAAGEYIVKFPTEIDGKSLVEANQGDDASDSDAGANGQTGVISVAIGETSSNNDAGVVDPGTASVGDTVWLDENGDGLLNNGEAGVGGVEVTLTGAGADGAFGTGDDTSETVTTAADGSYSFDELDAGDYKVTFNAAATGLAFTTASAAAADAANNDSDAGAGGMTDVFTLDIGEAELDIDAGLVSADPVAMDDDAGKTCADEAVKVDVLANDTDAPGETLTITEVNGVAIAEGETVVVDGVNVMLMGGQLSIDGKDAYEALDIGEEATQTIEYTVSDGLGGEATANVDVTFCGVAETLDELFASLPTSGTYQVATDSINPVSDEAFTIVITGTGDARFDGVVFSQAYCLSVLDPVAFGEIIADAPLNTADITDGKDGSVFNPDQISFANGEAAADNLDLINWIINQDFSSQAQFSDWEVQRAIWELTDAFDTVNLDSLDPGYGTDDDVNAIVQMAIDNGEGFMAGQGDLATLILDPNPSNSENSQPFIVAFSFDDNDCIC